MAQDAVRFVSRMRKLNSGEIQNSESTMLETSSLRNLLYATVSEPFPAPCPEPLCNMPRTCNVWNLPHPHGLSIPRMFLEPSLNFPEPIRNLMPATLPGMGWNSLHSRPEHYAVEENYTYYIPIHCVQCMYVYIYIYTISLYMRIYHMTKMQHHVLQIETECKISCKMIFVHDMFPSIYLL